MRFRLLLSASAAIAWGAADAATVFVTDEAGAPLPTVMVTQSATDPAPPDVSDGGYALPGKANRVDARVTRFTDAGGRVTLPDRPRALTYRLRKPGFRDAVIAAPAAQSHIQASLERETDAARLTEAKPANTWLGALDIGDAGMKKHFMLQCGFCHQQGSAPLRAERSAEDWDKAIERMMRYGARLASDAQKALPEKLSAGYRRLRENPQLVPDPAPWDAELASATITEWAIGDVMSQMHDMLLTADGRLYVGDNLQDRLYEIQPATGTVTVHKIPHKPGDAPGGLIAARLKEFPRHDSISNAHSLAQSPRDGHIFITPSAQQRIVEFDPAAKTFTLHEMDGGFYPHTIRVDTLDRVWFTLALSNQVGMLDRATGRFTLYDLPSRSWRESATVSMIKPLFKLMDWGVPLANWLPVDRLATGTPLPYGIDVAPDGKVWFTRLHTDEIGSIDPETGRVTLVATPFKGPRRLRADARGDLWISAFPESAIVRYEPQTSRFTRFDLPVLPRGSDTPYSLNVDRKRGIVWVNGNQSDALYSFHMESQRWKVYPLPRRGSFTRDVEIADDGSVYTTNSQFPGWHIEGLQPTLIHLEPDVP